MPGADQGADLREGGATGATDGAPEQAQADAHADAQPTKRSWLGYLLGRRQLSSPPVSTSAPDVSQQRKAPEEWPPQPSDAPGVDTVNNATAAAIDSTDAVPTATAATAVPTAPQGATVWLFAPFARDPTWRCNLHNSCNSLVRARSAGPARAGQNIVTPPRQRCCAGAASRAVVDQALVTHHRPDRVTFSDEALLALQRRLLPTPTFTQPTALRQSLLLAHLQRPSGLVNHQWQCLAVAAESVHALEQRLHAAAGRRQQLLLTDGAEQRDASGACARASALPREPCCNGCWRACKPMHARCLHYSTRTAA
jgi:hypothetical protein